MLNIDFGWSGRKKNIGKELVNVRVIRTFVIRFRQFFNEEFCDKNEGSGVCRGGKFTLFGIFVTREILLGTETFATPPRIELLQQFSKNIRKLKYICHRQPLSPTKKCQSLAFVIKRNSNKN
jgi:hypothetical protein